MVGLGLHRLRHSDGDVTYWSYLLAGPFMFAYGLVRWHQGLTGPRGPGVEWVVGHSLFLIAQLMMSFIILDLARRTAATLPRIGGAVVLLGWVGWLSKMLGSAQTVIDIVVGVVARDHHQMDDLYGRVARVPGVEPVVYSVGPVVFFVVLVVLSIIFATRVRNGRSTLAVVLLLVTLLLGSRLDLLPLTSVALTGAFCLLSSVRTRFLSQQVDEVGPSERSVRPSPHGTGVLAVSEDDA